MSLMRTPTYPIGVASQASWSQFWIEKPPVYLLSSMIFYLLAQLF
jgi:hypothetical protein